MAKAAKKRTTKAKVKPKAATKAAASSKPKAKASAKGKASAKPAVKSVKKAAKPAAPKKQASKKVTKNKAVKTPAPKAVKPKPAKKVATKVSSKTAKKANKKTSGKAARKVAPKKAPATAKARMKASAQSLKKAASAPQPAAPASKIKAKREETARNYVQFLNTMLKENTMVQGTQQFEKLTQDINGLGRESADAFIKSSTIFTKGFEDLYRTGLSLAQSTAEKQSQLVKQALSAKTLNEWAELQNQIAQNGFEDFMSNATKISELSVKLLTEASEPINKQLNDSIQSIQKATKMAA